MKKILSLIIIGSFASLIACGPSAEEKAAAEKARQDSINVVMEQMAADSMAKVQASMEKARQDSMSMAMHADSIAKAQNGKKPNDVHKCKKSHYALGNA